MSSPPRKRRSTPYNPNINHNKGRKKRSQKSQEKEKNAIKSDKKKRKNEGAKNSIIHTHSTVYNSNIPIFKNVFFIK